MKKTIKKYGKYAALVGALLFMGSHFIDWNMDYDLLEVFGYISILTSLSFIFFGIKHFRDKLNNGLITFKNALLIGLAISLISGLVIGILDIIYVTVINPDFVTEYMQYTLEGMESTLTPEQLAIEKGNLEKQMELFDYPGFSGLFMFVLVFTIGLIISLISSLILQRKNWIYAI